MPNCLAPYGGPVEPGVAFGGFRNDDVKTSTALVLTFLVDNHVGEKDLEPAKNWEKRFIELLKRWDENDRPEFMEAAFSSERSVQDELERVSEAEMSTVVISYGVMFIYIAIALGRIRSFRTILVDSKVTLAVGGIVVVLCSVVCSLGVFGYAQVPTTLLTIEVIPFLVLAVGVDNVFIIVQTHDKISRVAGEGPEKRVGETLARVGPSILLTSTAECCCFAIGALSDMPAVKTFAMYATVAVAVDFLLQITGFVALLSLDDSRRLANRIDVACCFRINVDDDSTVRPGILARFWSRFVTPFLLDTKVRIVVVVIFLFWLCCSIATVPNMPIGLDQELSMPDDSHVLKYFLVTINSSKANLDNNVCFTVHEGSVKYWPASLLGPQGGFKFWRY